MRKKYGTLTAVAIGLTLGGAQSVFGDPNPGINAPAVADAPRLVKGDAPNAAADMAMKTDEQVHQQLKNIQEQKDNLNGDRLFVLNAGLGNGWEVAYARQALQKSQSDQVKQVAQKIVADHEQANQQLMAVAQKLNVEIPAGLTSMKHHELKIKGMMEGKAYDQMFIADLDGDHAKDISCYRNTAGLAQSPEVKQYAAQTLPHLEEHARMVQHAGVALGLPSDREAQPASTKIPAEPDTKRLPSGTNGIPGPTLQPGGAGR